jgi:predicted permease
MSIWSHLVKRRTHRRDIDADIEAFLTEKTDALIESGLSPDEARYQARREFGNITLARERSREEWSWDLFEYTVGALRYTLRSLRRSPYFTVTVLLTLGLGIGINSAIFNLLHAVLLRSLPIPDAQQLRLLSVVRDQKEDEPIFSYPVFTEMQRVLGDKASLAGYSSIDSMRAAVGNAEPQPVNVQLVSGNFFRVLGVAAQGGRLLVPQDNAASGTYPAVISGAYWSRRFGRNPDTIGQTVNLNGTPVTIVGVSSDNFFGLQPGSRPDYWLPISAQHDLRYQRNFWNSNGDAEKPFMTQPEIRWLSIVARIRDAHAAPWVTAAINQVYGRDMRREAHGRDDPAAVKALLNSRVRLNAGDKGLSDLRNQFAAPLMVLMGASGLVLLIACVNLASLSLARVTARRKEIAVRYALGASRRTIAGHFVMETLVLSLAGGVLAIPIVLGASHLLLRWASNGDPMPLNISPGAPVLLFTALSAILAGLIFGLAPACQTLNIALNEVMKAQATSLHGARLPWGRTMIAIEVAFSFILLTGAVLFVRTFLNYADIALGFTPEHVITVHVDPMGAHIATERLLPVYHRVLDRLSEMTGVKSAAFAACGIDEGCKSISDIRIAGQSTEAKSMQENFVTPKYFETIGMHLLSGRMFTPHDTGKKPVLAVINATAAKLYFGGVNPVGRRYGYGGDREHFEIIGVAADARVNDVHEKPRPMAYYSLEQSPAYAGSLEIRVQGEPKAMEAAVRKTIRQAAPGLPIMWIGRLTEQVGNDLLRERLIARLASAFAVLALALACLGIYGTLSYAIARRTSEIGIRLALGAQRAAIRWMILRETVIVVGLGLAVGLPAAVAAMELVRGLVYGLSPANPTSILLGIVSLLFVACAAAFIPAWRASRVDPNVALRNE